MPTRTFLALVLAITLALATPVSATVEPEKKYYIREATGVLTEVACTRANEVNPNESVVLRWEPSCVKISSGQKVTWWNGRRPHDPGSELDEGACFLASSDNGVGLPGSTPPHQLSYTVKFYYDGVILRSTYDMNTTRACPSAIDPLQTTLQEAVLQYQCFIHPQMKGLVVVDVY